MEWAGWKTYFLVFLAPAFLVEAFFAVFLAVFLAMEWLLRVRRPTSVRAHTPGRQMAEHAGIS